MSSIDELQSAAARLGEDGASHPQSDRKVNACLAQYGVALRPPPGRPGQWPGGWLPGDDPVAIELREGEYPIHPAAVFDVPARIRFLDALAGHGNVRAAAASVGVSRETVYRARRRYADFAHCWDAALVHARARYEAELATRAIDGVAVPVFVRGEHVATWRRHDARYLLAHLARLDRRVEEQPEAVARAGRFDQLLAAMAGHAPLDDFAEALTETRRCDDPVPRDMPPTREEYILYARSDATMGPPPAGHETADWYDAEAEAMDECANEAAQQWDAWQAAGMALLDRVLAGKAAGDAARESEARDSVTCVNTPQDSANVAPTRRTPRTAPPPPAACGC